MIVAHNQSLIEKDNIVFQKQGDLFYYAPPIKPQNYVAAFDIDWTLTYAEKKLFPKDPDDIHLLPNRQEKLVELFGAGYTIALFTNQKVKGARQKSERVERITTLIKKLSVPVYAFIATGDDEYRKPKIGMWEKLKQFIPGIQYAFYVGDALGRPQDFSDSDKQFAVNVGIDYYSPDKFFDHDVILFNPVRNMVILVGMPGSGKSTYAERELVPLGFEHISRDALGGKARLLKVVGQAVKDGRSLAIDATHSKQEDRQVYYDIARSSGYMVTVLYFVRDGRGWNDLRDKKNRVPTMGYHIYFKNLVPPTAENTPGEVYLIDEDRSE